VHHVVLMHVPDGGQTLAEEFEGLGLAQLGLLVLVAEQGAVLCQLHHHVDYVVLDESVPQFDDVRVVHTGVQVDLALEQEQLVVGGGRGEVELGE